MKYNGIVAWILKSRFHRLLSKNTLLLAYSGRRSSRSFETPVNYVHVGDSLLVTSQRQRTWWRNFIDGAPIQVWLAGRKLLAEAHAVVESSEVARYLGEYLTAAPQIAKYFQVCLDPQGCPAAGDILAAAKDRVIVRISIKSD